MADALPSGNGSGAKRHSRVISASRTPLARRMTKGPLEDESPKAAEAPDSDASSSTITAEAANTPIPTTPFSPSKPPNQSDPAPPPPPPSKDFSYLLRPELYHPLSNTVSPIPLSPQLTTSNPKPKDIPPPFRTPSYQPSPKTTPLPTLLSNHNLRSAAIASSHRLCQPPPPPPSELFSLIYTRLACLTLINHLPLAAEESKALQDIQNPFYNDPSTGKNLLPWELRVLVIRLQGIGYGDARRAIGGYYDLAKEARAEIKASNVDDVEEKEMWKERLKELGWCVANALVEMGDLSGAVRHVESLRPRGEGERDEVLEGRLALLYVQIGDVDAARRCLSSYPSSNTDTDQSTSPLIPLLTMASGDYTLAATQFRSLLDTQSHHKNNDILALNLATCLFYIGKVDETLPLLEKLVEKGRSFHALTFNLATVYELCSERGRERKMEMAERVAGRSAGERGVVDFKL